MTTAKNIIALGGKGLLLGGKALLFFFRRVLRLIYEHLRLLGILPFTAIAMAATLAPRIEIYTILACSVHKPDIFKETYTGIDLPYSGFPFGGAPSISLPSAGARVSPLQDAEIGTRFTPDMVLRFGNHTQPKPTNPNLCASDPTVQAAVAKLTAGMSCTCHYVTVHAVSGIIWHDTSRSRGPFRVVFENLISSYTSCPFLNTDL